MMYRGVLTVVSRVALALAATALGVVALSFAVDVPALVTTVLSGATFVCFVTVMVAGVSTGGSGVFRWRGSMIRRSLAQLPTRTATLARWSFASLGVLEFVLIATAGVRGPAEPHSPASDARDRATIVRATAGMESMLLLIAAVIAAGAARMPPETPDVDFSRRPAIPRRDPSGTGGPADPTV